MQGLHLTADLYGCRCDRVWLVDSDTLQSGCADFVEKAGLQGVGRVTHSFPASAHGEGGVTAAILLAESHLCVHTWPEVGGVTIDIYVCNFGGDYSGKAHALMNRLLALFDPTQVERHEIIRGNMKNPLDHSLA